MTWKKYLFILAIASISLYGFLSVSGPQFTFPLDDAWIHQAYARNLANNSEWAYISGERSTGATSTLWVFILAIGYLVKMDPIIWSTILGALILSGIAVTGWKLATYYLPDLDDKAMLFPMMIVFEWHLLWAALSGMETLLFSFLVSLLLARLLIKNAGKNYHFNDWAINTLILAALTLTRPDGLSLIGPFLIFIWLSNFKRSEKRKTIFALFIGLLIILAPFLSFNYSISGTIFPNTLYAKQAEYSALLQTPLITRYLTLLKLPLVGIGSMFLPGFFYISINHFRQKKWGLPVVSFWILAFILLYALRLPLDFQHGRYIMPVMPIYLIVGAIGSHIALRKILYPRWRKIISKVGSISATIVLLVFWILGRNAYLNDTQFINSQMIKSARWIDSNLDPDALLAAHDIGALGYITQRSIIDLAGLISPELIPFLRDEEKLAEYLDEKNVEYLLVFPNWYSNLTKNREIIFQAEGGLPGIEDENAMAIFKWP